MSDNIILFTISRNGAEELRLALSEFQGHSFLNLQIWFNAGGGKTDQEGSGDFRFVARDTYARDRPWVKAAGLKQDGPLFVPLSRNDRGKRLTRRDVARIYQRRVGKDFSAHSTRVGAAVEQREAGVPTGLIAQAGG